MIDALYILVIQTVNPFFRFYVLIVQYKITVVEFPQGEYVRSYFPALISMSIAGVYVRSDAYWVMKYIALGSHLHWLHNVNYLSVFALARNSIERINCMRLSLLILDFSKSCLQMIQISTFHSSYYPCGDYGFRNLK